MSDRHVEAARLANRPYSSMAFLDESTEGEPVYVAYNPELEGCISQGETIAEALHNLNNARVDFIYFLLEDGLAVPEPRFISGRTPLSFSMPSREITEVYEAKPDYLFPQDADQAAALDNVTV